MLNKYSEFIVNTADCFRTYIFDVNTKQLINTVVLLQIFTEATWSSDLMNALIELIPRQKQFL